MPSHVWYVSLPRSAGYHCEGTGHIYTAPNCSANGLYTHFLPTPNPLALVHKPKHSESLALSLSNTPLFDYYLTTRFAQDLQDSLCYNSSSLEQSTLVGLRDLLKVSNDSFVDWQDGKHPCDWPWWKGVTCSCGSVVGLDLTMAAGPDLPLNTSAMELPMLLRDLKHLRMLAIPDAGLTGYVAGWDLL